MGPDLCDLCPKWESRSQTEHWPKWNPRHRGSLSWSLRPLSMIRVQYLITGAFAQNESLGLRVIIKTFARNESPGHRGNNTWLLGHLPKMRVQNTKGTIPDHWGICPKWESRTQKRPSLIIATFTHDESPGHTESNTWSLGPLPKMRVQEMEGESRFRADTDIVSVVSFVQSVVLFGMIWQKSKKINK